jgi:hypothetical protein
MCNLKYPCEITDHLRVKLGRFENLGNFEMLAKMIDFPRRSYGKEANGRDIILSFLTA